MLIHLGLIYLCKTLNSISSCLLIFSGPGKKLPKTLSFFFINMGILVLEPLLRLQRTIYVQTLDKGTG